LDPGFLVVGGQRDPARAPPAAVGQGQLGGAFHPFGFVVGIEYDVLRRPALLTCPDDQDAVVAVLNRGPAPRDGPPGLPTADEFLTISHASIQAARSRNGEGNRCRMTPTGHEPLPAA